MKPVATRNGMLSTNGGRMLTLFLSNGGSLERWEREAILSREMLLYLHFIETGVFSRVQVFSYSARDRGYAKRLAATDPRYNRISIIAPRRYHGTSAIRSALWGLWGPVRHRREIARSAALKTNQISGSWAAILSRILTKKPLVLRMGYLLSRRFAKNGHSMRARLAAAVEKWGFGRAARILVTSEDVAGQLAEDGLAERTVLTPTYVDVSLFKPKSEYRFEEPLVTVCRMTPQKNLENLIRACARTGRSLTLYGKGELEPVLRALAAETGANVNFAGLVANDQLAARLREHSVFVLPSFHEGLPKVLIEAMASGMVCVGSNIPGITDMIEDGVNGYLIDGFEPDDIAAALDRVHRERNPAVGAAARRSVEEIFSLEAYARREAGIYDSLT